MALASTYRPGQLETDERDGGTARTICLLEGLVTNRDALAAIGGCDPDGEVGTVIARAFEEIGERVLDAIDGSWSLLLWDRERKTGFAACDPLGGRPLHYAKAHDGLEIAGEVRELIRRLGGHPGIDHAGLAHWLARLPPPAGSTLFAGVRRLPAGHVLALEGPEPAPRRWWWPRYSAPELRDRDEATAVLRDAMAAAVSRVQPRDSGVLLSGGLDSLAVAALASGRSSGVKAFSATFPTHPEIDESSRIEIAAETMAIDVTRVEFAPASPIDAAIRFSSTWGLPAASPNGFIWNPLHERASADGVTTLLDGEGGDELFGCSPPLIADRLRSGRLLAAIKLARRLPGYEPQRDRLWVRRALRIYGFREALPAPMHRLARRLNLGMPQAPAPWLSLEARRLLDTNADLEWKRFDGPRWWAGLIWSLIAFPDAATTAHELRRIGATSGIERRQPWRDRRLIEVALSLPPEFAFDPDADRPLARAAIQGDLDERLRRPHRKPFFNHLLSEALAGPERDRLEELLMLSPPDELRPFVDIDQLERWLSSEAEIGLRWGPMLWPLLSVAIWLENGARSG